MERAKQATARAKSVLKAYQNPVSDKFIFDGSINGPEWYVSRISVPKEVNAGGIVDTTVEVYNERTVVTPANPNACTSGVFNGVESKITVDPDWSTNSESTTLCTEVGGLSPTIDTFTADFTAPDEPGTYTVEVTAETGNGDAGGTEEYEVLVVGEGSDPGDRPDDGDRGGSGGDDGDGGGGGGDDGGSSFLGTEQVIALAAFAILIVVALGVTQ